MSETRPTQPERAAEVHDHHDGLHAHDHEHEHDHHHGHSHDHQPALATPSHQHLDSARHGDHDHAHGHSHDHAGHHHGPRGYVTMQGALALSICLNLAFVIFEVLAARSSGSLALYSDAAHNTGDLVSLIFAWGATLLARRRPSTKFTYGLRGSTILAALANGILLLCASGARMVLPRRP